MTASQAIVTLAVGEEHSRRWQTLCEPNWREYGERHGFDLHCIERPLDGSERAAGRSPSWQKLLVLEQPFAREYERIAWVDADILFGREAPSLTEGVPAEKVGAVDELNTPTEAIRRLIHPETPEEYYAAAGLPGGFEQIVQGGLLVLSPAHHAELLRHVYDSYDDPGPDMNYEMRPLSYELLNAGLVHWLDPRFNCLWDVYVAWRHPYLIEHPGHPHSRTVAREALDRVFGLHFAARAERMDELLASERAPHPAGRRVEPARSPVVMLTFARPDTTARVLDAVRLVKPRQLLVVADGPRAGREDEAERCEQTRALIETVDWDCDVQTEFAEENMGLTRRIVSGLDWAFAQVEEAIVLEDDCVPDPSFFAFCDALLERYRDDERVMSISGNNFQFDGPASDDSYYFSIYPHIWGWATWRRAWAWHDQEMGDWPELRDSGWLDGIVEGPHAVEYWSHIFELSWRDQHTWDYAFLLACLQRGGLHAIPNRNLVSNVGFREDAVHTPPEVGELFSNLPAERMSFPLVHPDEVARNAAADEFTERVVYSGAVDRLFDRVRATIRQGEVPH